MGKRVLIIDDSPFALNVAKDALEGAGVTVETAPSAEAAETMLADGNLPDLILLDLILPGDHGRSLCQRIKADPRTRQVPVLLISGQSKEAMQQVVEEQGAEGFVAKAQVTNAGLMERIRDIVPDF